MAPLARTHTALLAALGLTLSCGGPAPDETAQGDDSAGDEQSSGPAEGHGPPPEGPIATMGWASDSHGVMRNRGAAPPAAGDRRALYQRLAPNIVIVRTPHSMGTGVVVGEGGLILTNNHVIRGAEHENFRVRVQVEFGSIGENGSMTPDGEQRAAWVLATNPATDLALLRVENPPEGLAPVPLAEENPTPGEPVVCMGHGNIGLVWAIRSCEVEGTGRLEDQYARLQAVCASEEPRAQAMCEHMRDHFHRRVHGLVVQSSCVIAPGDSGGPLVDPEGRLVGLNVFTMHNENGQSSNFHVHLSEMRSFLEAAPSEAMVDMPDPWMDDAEALPLDVDLDGRWDTIAMTGTERDTARIYDLDQDSTQNLTIANAQDVVRARGFDAELAVVHRGDGTYTLYDTDGDNRFDVILSMSHNVQVDAAHRVSPSGAVTADASLLSGPPLRAELLPPGSRHRFEGVFHGLLGEHEHPEPLPGMLRRAHLHDNDGDGTFDTLRADRADAHAVVFDADQNSLVGIAQPQLERLVQEGQLDAEVSLIQVDRVIFAYYDRDGDGQMDAGFRTPPNSYVVAEVLALPGVANQPDPNDYIGTFAIRPQLVSQGQARLPTLLTRQLPRSWFAQTEETTGLPHPVTHHLHPNVTERENVSGWDHAIASLASRGLSTLLVDVNRDSFHGRGRRHLADGIGAAIGGGHFSAEFALVTSDGVTWAWYDTDLDGDWDVVLARVDAGQDHVQNAFRWQEDGFRHDPALVEGRVIRPALFGRRHQRRFRAMAEEVFEADHIQPAE